MRRHFLLLALSLAPICAAAAEQAATDTAARPLRERLNDLHAVGADHWIYNDLEKAKEAARRENKPIFVTFRCVPCKSCASFDAEVAKGSELITTLARTQFIPLRLVEMKGVDLSQFEYDFDLNWAAMFINADGTVYGRYGTQSAQGPDAYNSVESLQKAMLRALDLHRAYPANAPQLAAKHPSKKPYATALDMPGLDRKERLRGQTERGNCIHCHNIHDAEQRQWLTEGKMSEDKLWRYPLPDNTGISIDPKDGTRIATVLSGTPAEKAGLKTGDVVKQVNGQPVISIADMQWVLHGLANSGDKVAFTVARGKDPVNATLELAKDWKRSDISWRGSMWSLRPRPG
ncbi:MAG TPA: Trx7/PDZ domain-containing (seleno)protein, partial [Roseimicrobium sp.]|nr:Trx7/PDZ domain-containing (seleno)protein [Roseimicrobium sp.]